MICYPKAHLWTDRADTQPKMAKDNMMMIILVGIVIYFVSQGGFGSGGTSTDSGNTVPGGCAIDPQFTLEQADKWGATSGLSTAHKYIVNGGTSNTYGGSAVTTPLSASVEVLWFDGNASSVPTAGEAYFREISSHVVSQCGINQFKNLNGVRNASLTLQCFNEEGNLIDDLAENETISTGETASIDCEIRGVAEKGVPHGGVLVVETPKTAFDESKTLASGGPIQGTTTVPSFHSLSATTNAVKAFNVAPITGASVHDFTFNLEAESDQDPSNTDDVTLTLYTSNCYEDEETNSFACGIEDEDQAATGYVNGVETVSID